MSGGVVLPPLGPDRLYGKAGGPQPIGGPGGHVIKSGPFEAVGIIGSGAKELIGGKWPPSKAKG